MTSTYGRSQSVMNPIIEAKAAIPITIIPSASSMVASFSVATASRM